MGRSIIQKPSEGLRSARPQTPERVLNPAQVASMSSAHLMPPGGQFPDTAVTSHLERRASVPEASSAIAGAQRVEGPCPKSRCPRSGQPLVGGGVPPCGALLRLVWQFPGGTCVGTSATSTLGRREPRHTRQRDLPEVTEPGWQPDGVDFIGALRFC